VPLPVAVRAQVEDATLRLALSNSLVPLPVAVRAQVEDATLRLAQMHSDRCVGRCASH